MKIENIKMLQDKVLIERMQKEETRTVGGLYLPEQTKEKALNGTVVSVGPGKISSTGVLQPMNIKVGQIVFFGKYAGTEIDDKYIIVKEDEILGIL